MTPCRTLSAHDIRQDSARTSAQNAAHSIDHKHISRIDQNIGRFFGLLGRNKTIDQSSLVLFGISTRKEGASSGTPWRQFTRETTPRRQFGDTVAWLSPQHWRRPRQLGTKRPIEAPLLRIDNRRRSICTNCGLVCTSSLVICRENY